MPRLCENCSSKMPPFVPRKRMEDGTLVCATCASGRPGGGNTQASRDPHEVGPANALGDASHRWSMLWTTAVNPRDAEVFGTFHAEEGFLLDTRDVKGLRPHDREAIYRSMVSLADEDTEIRPLTWEQAKKEKVQVDSARHTAARSREDVLLMADRLQQMIDRRDCDYQLLSECVALLDDLYDEGLSIMGARHTAGMEGQGVMVMSTNEKGIVVEDHGFQGLLVRFEDGSQRQIDGMDIKAYPNELINAQGSRRTAAWEQYGDVWINETADYDLQVQPEGDGWVYMVRTPGRETISGQVRPDEGDLDDALDIAEAVLTNEFGVTASRKHAHDSGDGETIYHCPFCGSGQVTARSDGSAWCEFCRNGFTVQVQPEHNSMPQTEDGQPVDNPDMPGEPAQPDWERPVQTEIPEQFQTEPEPNGEHPMPSGQVAFRTAEGHLLDRDAYLARLALRTSPNKAATLAKVRGYR